jgi:hypothetical protein
MRPILRNIAEGVIIALGILSFWPLIFGYGGLWYQVGLMGVLGLLGVLAAVRFRRVRRAFDREDQLPAGAGSPPEKRSS